MSSRLQDALDRSAEALARAREWLRRVMPRVAVAAVALYLLRLLIADTWLYRETPVGLLGVLTFCAAFATVVYYGLKILVRLKRLLLWRVRRRLIITYLFVGLTPVVLLLLLGALAATGVSSQAMVRVVTVEVGATERRKAGSTTTRRCPGPPCPARASPCGGATRGRRRGSAGRRRRSSRART